MSPLETMAGRRPARRGGTELYEVGFRHPVPSPDGTRLAVVSDRDGRPRLWVVPMPEGDEPAVLPRRPLMAAADMVAVSWSPDGAWLACEIAPEGGQRTRVLLVGPDSGEVREIARGGAVTLGAWSSGGHHLGVTVYAEGRGAGQACVVDLRDGTSVVVGSGPDARVCAIDSSSDERGFRRAVVRHGRRSARELELVDLRSGRRTPLIPGGDATVADAWFGVTGGQLYLHTDAGGERPALLAVTVRGQHVSAPYPVAARADDDLDLVTLDPSGARGALVWNVEGRSEVELIDLRSGRIEPVAEPPGTVVTAVAFTRDGAALIAASEGPTLAPLLSRLSLAGYAEHTVLLPDTLDEDTALVGPTLHTFRGVDGVTLAGWLYRAPGSTGAQPTLIWLHGGPEGQERPVFQPLFQALVAAGVAVFAPNVRGSSGYGRQFATADDREGRFAAVTDVRTTVEFLTAAGLADRTRVGLAGHSYGGYLTLKALADFPALFAVAVDVAGISDFATFFAGTEAWIGAAATAKYGDPDLDAALLHSLSPLHQADRIGAPLLVVHGAHDTLVPVAESVQLVAALRAGGAHPRFLLLPDEGHDVRGLDDRARLVREVVRWVAGHLVDHAERSA